MSKDFHKCVGFLLGSSLSDRNLLSRLLTENSAVLYEVDKHGHNLLIRALMEGASHSKMSVLFQVDQRLAASRYGGRFPLHVAIENNASPDVLALLIDSAPEVVSERDRDLRHALHMLFEYDSFEPNMFGILRQLASIYPTAMQERAMGQLPLHMCLERIELPANLVCFIIHNYRAAASQPNSQGWLPLHTAVENSLDTSIIEALIDAFPAAVLRTVPGTDLTLLEYSLSQQKPKSVMECLLFGCPGGSKNPRVIACCYSSAIGKVGRPYGSSSAEDEEQVDGVHTQQTRRAAPSLSLAGTVESVTLSTCGIVTETPVVRSRVSETWLHDPNCITLVLSFLSGGSQEVVQVLPHMQVAELKQLVERRFRVPYSKQRLMLGTVQLMASYRIGDYGIEHNTRIEVADRAEALHYAIKGNAPPEIQLALLRIRPVSAAEEDATGCLPLHLAVQRHTTPELVERLVDEYPKAVYKGMSSGKLGEYPLHVALDRGYPGSVIKKLLQSTDRTSWSPNGNFNPSMKQPLYKTQAQCGIPLHIAIKGGLCASVELLLEHGCPIEARDEFTGNSALECLLSAPEKASTELFDVVLRATLQENESAIESQGANGQCPLHVAVQNGAAATIIQTLLTLGPHVVSQTDAYGNLPLHLAIRSGANFTVVRTLLQSQPQAIYFADRRGRTPLLLAVMHRAPPGVVFEIGRYDTADGCAFQVKDHMGRGVLEVAVSRDAPPHILNEILSCTAFKQDLDLLSRNWPDNEAARHTLKEVMRNRLQTRTGDKNKVSSQAVRTPAGGAEPVPVPGLPTSLAAKARQPRGPAVKSKERPMLSAKQAEEPSFFGSVASWFSWS